MVLFSNRDVSCSYVCLKKIGFFLFFGMACSVFFLPSEIFNMILYGLHLEKTASYIDKIFHFLIYLLLVSCLLKMQDWIVFFKIGVYLFIMGVMIEYGQSFISYRGACLFDIIANGLGILCGGALKWYLRLV